MPATWMTALAWGSLASAFASAAVICFDVYRRGYRQHMPIMEAVWPITALYFGPAAVWAYRRFGRPMTDRWQAQHRRDEPPDQPDWAFTAVGVSHCGVETFDLMQVGQHTPRRDQAS